MNTFYSACINHRYRLIRQTIKLYRYDKEIKPKLLTRLIFCNVPSHIIDYWFTMNSNREITVDLLLFAYQLTDLNLFTIFLSHAKHILNERDKMGRTILYKCVDSNEYYPEKIKILLDQRNNDDNIRIINPNIECIQAFNLGYPYTPLGVVIKKHCLGSDRFELIKDLLDAGANPNMGTDGRKPLDIWIHHMGQKRLLLLLMRYGATDYHPRPHLPNASFDVTTSLGVMIDWDTIIGWDVVIHPILIVCDMMLHIDGIPSEWIREIKGCMY